MAQHSETSAGGVVFRRVGAGIEVALGEQRDRLTGASTVRLPKGKALPGETPEQTALREVAEETGLSTRIVSALGAVDYTYREGGRRVDKTVHFFLMELAPEAPTAPDGEFQRVFWCPVEGAGERLTFPLERRVLARARERLEA